MNFTPMAVFQPSVIASNKAAESRLRSWIFLRPALQSLALADQELK